jgi:mono/diheme cytochrome c family protein
MKSFTARAIVAGMLMALVAATTDGAAQNPQTPGQPALSGSLLFANYCATCHGERATGDGPLAANLRKQPANLTLLARRNGGVFSPEMVARIIDGRKPLAGHGGGDMPAWGDAFARSAENPGNTSGKINALVTYLETLQQK